MNNNDTNENLSHQLPIGTVLHNRYEIGRVIGQGGFGITYEGYDLDLRNKVAIKEYYPSGYAHRSNTVSNLVTILNAGNVEFIRDGMNKFLHEAEILTQCIEYPGVVKVKDYFEENNTAYIVMEFLDGIDLKHKLKEQLFNPEELIELLRPIFDTLVQLHKLGIIHRDISPDNIMILENGSAKLMDFGAARLVNFDDERSLSIVLKAGYAPGEQYRKRGKQGPWTDIYALCATMYKCITGITPDDALEREQSDILKKPSELGIEIDDRIERILMIGLAVMPNRRFQSVEELIGALWEGDDLDSYEHICDDDEDDRTVSFVDAEDDVNQKEVYAQTQDIIKKRIGLLVGAGVITAVLVAVSVFMGKRLFTNNGNITSSNNIDTLNHDSDGNTEGLEEGSDITENHSDEEAVSADDMYKITLSPHDSLSIEGYLNAYSIIEDRIKVLCGDKKYDYEIVGDKINIGVPTSVVLDEKDLESITETYIANGNAYEFVFWPNREGVNNVRLDLTNDVIEDAKIQTGTIPNFDLSEYSNIDSQYLNNYQYIELTFNEEFWDKYDYAFKDKECVPVISIYILYGEGIFSWNEFELHYVDERKAAIYMDKSEYKHELGMDTPEYNLLINNLTTENIDYSFKYEVEWKNIEWLGEENERFGNNQCNIEELEDDYVCISYSLNKKKGEFPDEDRNALLDVLCTRLDAIDSPYSIGFNSQYVFRDQYIYLYCAIPLKHMGVYVADIISSTRESFSVAANEYSISLDYGNAHFSFPKYENSKCLVIEYEDKYKDEIESITAYLIDKGVDTLYLEFDNEYLCSMSLNEPVTDGKLAFTELTHETDSEDTWQWNLFEAVINNSYSAGNISYNKAQFISRTEGRTVDASDFKVSPIVDVDKLNQKIQNIAPGAKVRYSNSTSSNKMEDSEDRYLYVDLNLSVNGYLAESAVEYISNILQILKFDQNSWVRKVEFNISEEDYYINRDGSVAQENASIIVSRSLANSIYPGDMDRDYELDGISHEASLDEIELTPPTIMSYVSGGRYDEISDSIVELMKKDEYLGSGYFNIK